MKLSQYPWVNVLKSLRGIDLINYAKKLTINNFDIILYNMDHPSDNIDESNIYSLEIARDNKLLTLTEYGMLPNIKCRHLAYCGDNSILMDLDRQNVLSILEFLSASKVEKELFCCHCHRPNDIGIKECWWCGQNPQPKML